jgi:type II secretory pathway component PulJ
MRNRYKGTFLVEAVVAVAIFAMIMVPFAHLCHSLAAGIPTSYKLYQLNTSVLNAMQTLRADVAKADSFILSDNADGKGWTLTLKAPSVETIYIFNDGLLCRGENENNQTWKLPMVKLKLKPFVSEPDAHAVEVRTYISFKEYGKERKKLENNYLFYAGQLEKSEGGAL